MQERDDYGRSNGNRDQYNRRSMRQRDDDYGNEDIAGASYGDWDETSPTSRDLSRASSYSSDRSGRGNQQGGGSGRNIPINPSNREHTGVPYRGAYGGGYESRQGGRFQSFRPDDYGGADFTGSTPGTPYGGFGATYGEGAYGRMAGSGAGGGYTENRNDRGFFDKASDEVASWFGDEEAARRREMDHSGKGPTGYSRSDERIREDVCDKLTEDWQVDASEVNVMVESGEVTLDGTVDSRAAKRRAEDCVDRISGVRHVQNNLRVRQAAMGQGSAFGSASGTGSASSGSASSGTSTNDGFSSH